MQNHSLGFVTRCVCVWQPLILFFLRHLFLIDGHLSLVQLLIQQLPSIFYAEEDEDWRRMKLVIVRWIEPIIWTLRAVPGKLISLDVNITVNDSVERRKLSLLDTQIGKEVCCSAMNFTFLSERVASRRTCRYDIISNYEIEQPADYQVQVNINTTDDPFC